jgi:hypothetical protein
MIVGKEDYQKIRDILWMAYAEAVGVDAKSGAAQTELKVLLARKNLNKTYQGELYAAQGILFYLSKDVKEAKKSSVKASGFSKEGILYSLLNRLLSEDKNAAAAALYGDPVLWEDAFYATMAAGLCESAGRWKAAAAVYERLVDMVPFRLKKHFEEKLIRARDLTELDGFASSFSGLAAKPELSWEEALLALKESVPQVLPPGAKTAEDLLEYVADRNALLKNNTLVSHICSRQDIAYLLTHLLSDYKKDASLLVKFTNRYGNGGKSPVPDVPSVFASFDACLLMVEWEIMDLPDGKKFFPDTKIRGDEYLKSLKAFKELL